jgi:hypothetical protein
MEENLAPDSMVGCPDLLEVEERVYGSEEGTVEPTSTLGNELGYGVCNMLASAVVRTGFVSLPGTSVSPVAALTYFKTHCSLRLATSSQHRIRSSAKYMFAVKTSAS